MNWEPQVNYFGIASNFILRGEDFRISYNPNTKTATVIDAFCGEENADGSFQETAILKDNKYYILNGDHRKEYEELLPQGFDACHNYYLSKPELKSGWSTD